MTFLAFLFLALALLAAGVWMSRQRRAARTAFIESYRFPPGIRARVQRRYPHLGDADLDRVLSGLAAWLHVSHQAAGKPVSMPSQAVDAAWHEFILFTRNYRDFCRKALGRFLHHTPAEAMCSPTEAQEGIRRAWRLSCAREGIDPRAPARLPLLFALDADLGIADGFRYALDCGARRAGDGAGPYCAAHIGCGSGAGDGGCSSDSGCGGDGGGCGGGGGD
jgi:hypothetical protein